MGPDSRPRTPWVALGRLLDLVNTGYTNVHLQAMPYPPPWHGVGGWGCRAEAADGTLSEKTGGKFGFSIHGEKACHEPMTCQKSET